MWNFTALHHSPSHLWIASKAKGETRMSKEPLSLQIAVVFITPSELVLETKESADAASSCGEYSSVESAKAVAREARDTFWNGTKHLVEYKNKEDSFFRDVCSPLLSDSYKQHN